MAEFSHMMIFSVYLQLRIKNISHEKDKNQRKSTQRNQETILVTQFGEHPQE